MSPAPRTRRTSPGTQPLPTSARLTAPIAALTAATLTAVILTYTTAATPNAATDTGANESITRRGKAIAQHYHATLGIATHAIGVGIITTAATLLLPAVHPAAPRGIEVLAFSAVAYYAIIVTAAAARLVEYARIQDQHAL